MPGQIPVHPPRQKQGIPSKVRFVKSIVFEQFQWPGDVCGIQNYKLTIVAIFQFQKSKPTHDAGVPLGMTTSLKMSESFIEITV